MMFILSGVAVLQLGSRRTKAPKPIGLDLFKRLCRQVNKTNAPWNWHG